MRADTTSSKPKRRTVQEVFNVVMDAGLYGVGKPYFYMCNALKCAGGYYGDTPIITPAEYVMAKRSICLYLRLLDGDRSHRSDTLVCALGMYTDDWRQHLPLLEGIYRNWGERPRRPLGITGTNRR